MLTETALDAVENNFNVKLDRKNLRFPKLRFKGPYRPAVIRKTSGTGEGKVDELLQESFNRYLSENDVKPKPVKMMPQPSVRAKDAPGLYTTPKYSILHRNILDLQEFTNDKTAKMNATVPNELVVEINLPLLSSSVDVALDVMEKSLKLVSEAPAKYKLELQLPYSVDEERGSAKFDQTARKLIVTLPVKYGKRPYLSDIGKEDSGVECDHSCHTSESSSGDEVNVESQEIETCNTLRTSDLSPDTNVGYRTSNNDVRSFLKPDICYSLPSFTCNAVDDMVVFTLHVKNVDASSVEHCYIAKSGVHVKFISIGSGFFPLSYAFCVIFPPECCVEDSANIETWDNNVILQVQLKSCNNVLTEYFVGIDEASTVKHILPEPAAIGEKLKCIEMGAGGETSSTDDERLKVNITRSTEDDVVEITCTKNEVEDLEDVFESSDKQAHECTEVDGSEKSGRTCEFDDGEHDVGSRKARMYSESSADEMGSSPAKKGILKRNGRVSRSLSESSIDEYTWSSLDVVTHSGSESYIREEDEDDDDDRGAKKTVRFNDVICRKTFRPNSSILGQKKKNQRKQRNKKRAQERRASESENSEGEAERERLEKEDSVDEDSIGIANFFHDEGICGEEEKSLHSPSESVEEHFVDVPKSSRSKGKRKNRKGPSKQKMEAVRRLEFKSDLIFDLDM